MESIKLKFPDTSVREFAKGVTGKEVAKSISNSLARDALAIEFNGEVWDLSRKIDTDGTIKILKWEDPGGKYAYWHSSAHLMAESIESLFPGTKFGIGPPIDKGFYYDIDMGGHALSQEDLHKIEGRMVEFAKRDVPFVREEKKWEDAVSFFRKKNDPYKLELLEGLKGQVITFYHQGNFTDLCYGPHIPSTGRIKAIKLLSVAGAYWRGDEKRKMLQRIYGISFPNKEELDAYLFRLEEAKRRDHRKLGKELELFVFHDVAPGAPFWLPKGMIVFRELEAFLRSELDRRGYQEIGTLHRNELSGALGGMFRVRQITMDDAHIYCRPDQILSEIDGPIDLITQFYSIFGLTPTYSVSTRPDNAMGDVKLWDQAETSLKNALANRKIAYTIRPKEGAFYGPKIDVQIEDAIGREWQVATIQLDFVMLPERFELEFVAEDGSRRRPFAIHRAIFGSFERFIGIITEHFVGAFPAWLSPVQAVVLPITDAHLDYANKVCDLLRANTVRAEIDGRNEKIGHKIREWELRKVPYMLVVGEKEASAETVSVRQHKRGDLGSMASKAFVERIRSEISQKLITSEEGHH